MFRLGLTGGIAMGKSTAAAMFAAEGVPVFDADKAVHGLYRGAAVPLIAKAFPGTTTADGVVDRARLAAVVTKDPALLARLEAIVHPLVETAEAAFLTNAERAGHRIALLDIPLLFETGAERRVDAVAVVSTTPDIQAERIRSRGLGEAEFGALLSRQVSDAEKRRRAQFVIDTGGPLAATRDQVRDVLRALAATTAAR
jgi:dephospho-CoA kinase